MFGPLKAESSARFTSVESFFKASRGMPTSEEKTARGVAFVLMYAAYEYTVSTAVQNAIDTLSSHRHRVKNLTPPLMALFLDRELQILKSCSHKSVWAKRLDLFEKAFSNEIASLPNTVLPTDGEHYRSSHLKIIFSVLGIKTLPVRRKNHLVKIDEIVEHRNAIAHGRETPDQVGRRYTREDVLNTIRQMKRLCLFFVSEIESHCASASRHRRV